VRRRLNWIFWFCLSAMIGFGVLIFRFIQAAATAQLYSHPCPVKVLLDTARDHADEHAGVQ